MQQWHHHKILLNKTKQNQRQIKTAKFLVCTAILASAQLFHPLVVVILCCVVVFCCVVSFCCCVVFHALVVVILCCVVIFCCVVSFCCCVVVVRSPFMIDTLTERLETQNLGTQLIEFCQYRGPEYIWTWGHVHTIFWDKV